MTNSATTLYAEPKGIGGWLVLPMLGTIVSPLVALWGILQTIPLFEIELPPGLQAFVIAEIIFHFGLMVGWIVAAIWLFKHKRSFPSLFITMLMVTFGGALVDAAIGTSVFGTPLTAEDYRTLARGLVDLLIWVPYMAKSKRV